MASSGTSTLFLHILCAPWPAFEHAEAGTEGLASGSLFTSYDRFGRSLTHLALSLDAYIGCMVPLIASSQGMDTSDSNPTGRLQLGVRMIQYSSGSVTEKVTSYLLRNFNVTRALLSNRSHDISIGLSCGPETDFIGTRVSGSLSLP